VSDGSDGSDGSDTRPEVSHHDRRVVVGIDGSTGSDKALLWAAAQAQRTGAILEVVGAWSIPAAAGYTPGVVFEEFEKAVEDVSDQAVTRATELYPDLEVQQRIVESPAAPALVEASEGAELLVVGSRGRGGFRELLLGSVSQYCAHHADCPVVIVPSHTRSS
jgi:nucleotide-binding universal stress UspA family protein